MPKLYLVPFFILIGLIGGLSGCGQTGSLYLPEDCPPAAEKEKIYDKYGKF